MINVECKHCKGTNKIQESDYKPGSHVIINCWRCGEDIEVDIPGDYEPIEESHPVNVAHPTSESAAFNEEIIAAPLADKKTDVELEKARMVLEAEKIKLEHRRMDHEERMHQSKMAIQGQNDQLMLNSSGKNKTTAGLLAIFLGGFGVHKFYLGKTGIGVVYLLLCWTYIPSLIGFIEGIIYLTKSDAEFHKSY